MAKAPGSPWRTSLRCGQALVCLALGLVACEEPTAPPMGQPVEGAWISDAFGPRPVHPVLGARGTKDHEGVDFAIRQGAPFKATMAGEVFEAGPKGSYGLAVFLRHQDGYETRYGHASKLFVKSGMRVAAGQVLGLVGSTGRSTGPHLHYELRQHGKAIDPMPFLARSQDGPSPLPSPSPRPSRFVWPSPAAYALPSRGAASPSPRPRPGAKAKAKAAPRPAALRPAPPRLRPGVRRQVQAGPTRPLASALPPGLQAARNAAEWTRRAAEAARAQARPKPPARP